MSKILGIETSCDETAAAIFDSANQKLLASVVFSQIDLHEIYGGVVPEIASRSHLEKIDLIIGNALREANVSFDNIDVIAVTSKPGLVGSLLVGFCFAKSIAWIKNKKLITVDHLEAHIYSSFLEDNFSLNNNINFPHICLSASGGSTAFYFVKNFGEYALIGQTLDDAAGEAFDKVAKVIGFGYPGGAKIEKSASNVGFIDFFKYPRTKNINKSLDLSFSGLKTAVLYDLVKRDAYNLKTGPIVENITTELQEKVSSSLLVCIADIFQEKLELAFELYPEAEACTFVGGVACNKYLKNCLDYTCKKLNKKFFSPSCKFCSDNAAMVALVGSYKTSKKQFASLDSDVLKD